jgi:quercetin 2,3-dioxygenase
VRVLVGEGSPIELGTPALILDVELPDGGSFATPVPAEFNGFLYMLEGDAVLGVNQSRATQAQIAVLGPGGSVTVSAAQPATRFMLMAGRPYREQPVFNGPYVD